MLLAVLLLSFAEPNYLPVACGKMDPQETITAVNPDGSYVGRMYEFTTCSSGGRGSKPRRYAGCYAMVWNADFTVRTHEPIPLEVVTVETCFAP